MKNAISWFEIPSTNLDKSQSFYEAVLGCQMRREPMGQSLSAIFPFDKALDGVGGAILCGPSAPAHAKGGVLIYLDCGATSIDLSLQRVATAGGTVAMPRQALPPGLGFIAHIDDLEGNRIGLHSLS
jgi:uncharacterized protein